MREVAAISLSGHQLELNRFMNLVALLQVTEAASSALAGVVRCEWPVLPYRVSSSRQVSVAVSSHCCCDPLSTSTAALKADPGSLGKFAAV